jgi:hypothetical protein
VGDIASLYRRDKPQHDANARDWTRQYAKPEFAKPPVVAKASVSSIVPIASSSSTASSSAASAKASTKPTGKPTIIDLDDDDDEPITAGQVRNAAGAAAAASRKRRTEDGTESGRAASRPRLNAPTSAHQVIELD